MDEDKSPYLWDRTGAPDPEIERLENLLTAFRHTPQPLAWERLAWAADAGSKPWAARLAGSLRHWRLAGPVALATAAVILVAFFGVRSRFEWIPGQPWKVAATRGAPLVETTRVLDTAHLAVGQALETDASSRARLSIGGIGVLDVEPNSRLRLLETRKQRHRIALDYGTVEAHTWAPPFSFSVDTPSSALFDLGCSFTLHVDRDGYGLVHVDSGWVQFEYGDIQALVPAGAEAVTRPDRGPGTPYFADASAVFKAALAEFDTSPEDSPARTSALDALLLIARPHDAITLMNLLRKVGRPQRERVLDLLVRTVPIPRGFTREQVLNLENDAMDHYWQDLGLGNPKNWIMHWKDMLGD